MCDDKSIVRQTAQPKIIQDYLPFDPMTFDISHPKSHPLTVVRVRGPGGLSPPAPIEPHLQ